jgi:glycosyltransferase 2 family protein
MKKRILQALQYIFFLGLGLFLIYWKAAHLSPAQKQQLYDAFGTVNLTMLTPVILAGFLSHWFRAMRWRLLLQPLDIHTSKINTIAAVMIGYLANLLVPRMGEVAKCTVLAKYEKVPADKMVGTIVSERIFDLLCLVLISLLAFALQYEIVGTYIDQLSSQYKGNGYRWIIFLGIALLLVLFVYWIKKKKKESKVYRLLSGVSAGIKSIWYMKNRGLFLFYTLLIWSMYTLMIIIGFKSLPATASFGILEALVVLVFGSVGMIVTQGGIGAYPVIVGQILMLYNVNEPIGLAFGWVSWMAQTGIIIIFGLLALLLLPLINKHYGKN